MVILNRQIFYQKVKNRKGSYFLGLYICKRQYIIRVIGEKK
jgi:hypothetical protein